MINELFNLESNICLAAGGVDNAIKNALDVNAKSFALFLRNQRSWTAKPLDLEVIFFKQCMNQDPK